VEHAPPLFLRSSDLIHSMCDTLQFWVFIQILGIHDFNLPSNSEDESSLGGDSSGEDYPRYDLGCGFLQPWSWVYRLAYGSSPAGEPCLSLPSSGRGGFLVHDGVGWHWPSNPRLFMPNGPNHRAPLAF
jgi:hypothetical protein